MQANRLSSVLGSPAYCSRQQYKNYATDALVMWKKHYKEIPDAHLQRIENLKKSKVIVKNGASNKETKCVEWSKSNKSPGKKQAGETSLRRKGDTKSEGTEMSLQGNTAVTHTTKNYIRFIMSQIGGLVSTVVHLEHCI